MAADQESGFERIRRGGEVDQAKRAMNRNKSRIRARVEHVFAVLNGFRDSRKCAIAACNRTPRTRAGPSRALDATGAPMTRACRKSRASS